MDREIFVERVKCAENQGVCSEEELKTADLYPMSRGRMSRKAVEVHSVYRRFDSCPPPAPPGA